MAQPRIDSIFFQKTPGHGEKTFVLIHNAGGNHLFFKHQHQTLSQFGTVYALDLPGHGQTPSTGENSIDDLSALIEALAHHHNWQNICLIGLNNGGNIALNIAFSKKISIDSLVLIDPPLLMPDTFIHEINQFIQHLDHPETDKSFVTTLVTSLLPYADSATKKTALDAFLQVDHVSLKTQFKSLIQWDKKSPSILPSIQPATLCILTDEHHCRYTALQTLVPQWTLGKVIGSHCWATLEVPEQINAMLARFIPLSSNHTT